MNAFRACLKFLIVTLFIHGVIFATHSTEGRLDDTSFAIEDVGFAVNGSRVGIGTNNVGGETLEVRGTTRLSGLVTYLNNPSSEATIDWTKGNCQRVVISNDGPVGIVFSANPTTDANLILSVAYETDSPGKMTVTLDPNLSGTWLKWARNVSMNSVAPISHNIDVLRFSYRKSKSLYPKGEYFGYATFWYRAPQ